MAIQAGRIGQQIKLHRSFIAAARRGSPQQFTRYHNGRFAAILHHFRNGVLIPRAQQVNRRQASADNISVLVGILRQTFNPVRPVNLQVIIFASQTRLFSKDTDSLPAGWRYTSSSLRSRTIASCEKRKPMGTEK